MKKLNEKLIGWKLGLMRGVTDLIKKEDGDTNFVSIMLIIVIVIAVATLFKSQLLNVVSSVMNELMDWVG